MVSWAKGKRANKNMLKRCFGVSKNQKVGEQMSTLNRCMSTAPQLEPDPSVVGRRLVRQVHSKSPDAALIVGFCILAWIKERHAVISKLAPSRGDLPP